MVYEVKEWEGTENQRTPLFMHLKLFDGLTGSDRHLLELGENISKLNLLKCTLNFKNINERINIYSLVRPEVVIRNFEMYSTGIHLVMTKNQETELIYSFVNLPYTLRLNLFIMGCTGGCFMLVIY